MVDIKDELDRTGHELVELRKAKDEHIQIIEDLKVRNYYDCEKISSPYFIVSMKN